ncbi:MAG: response regulator transcription factor [Alphaproteobacteria bacterium]|nr:response regulator transcription factor [Alphaproteobacteria bacterium]
MTNKVILIIDDDDILRNALAKGLRKDGFDIITSPSAENATDILKRIRVNAIVLDRMMTGMDGLTFLKKIRGTGDTTPVIMLTAMTGAENAIDGLSGGANDYLAKPFQIRELVLRLNNIIKNAPCVEPTAPNGMTFINNEFYISDPTDATSPTKILALSGEEKKLLQHLITPIGNIVPASPMVAKRLRNKINVVLSNLDIITIRGRGYKLVDKTAQTNN